MNERTVALRALGVTGDTQRGSLSEAVWAGSGWFPLVVLGVVDGLVLAQGLVLLSVPTIATTVGHTEGTTYFLLFFFWLLGVTLAGPFGLRFAIEQLPRPAVVAVGVAAVGIATVGVAAATSRTALGVAAGIGGVGSLLTASARRPLLADLYPPAARARVNAACRGLAAMVVMLAGILITLLPAATAATWRLGVAFVGLAAIASAVAVLRLEDAAVGRLDVEAIRAALRSSPRDAKAQRRPGLAESVRRVTTTPTARPLLTLVGLAGALAFTLPLYGGFLMSERGGASRSMVWFLLLSAALVAGVTATLIGPHVEAAIRRTPAAPLHGLFRATLATGIVLAVGAWLPLAGQAVAIVAGAGLVAALVVTADSLLTLTIPGPLRGAGAVLSATVAASAAMAATNLLSRADGEWGTAVAMTIVGGVTAMTAAACRVAARNVDDDCRRVADELVELEEMESGRSRGTVVPLLACRRINFSYGPLQVLFDVDFTVADGEMVALLGTNGAGKSTLLRVLSGIGMPSSGTVRFRGVDITYAEPGERVRAGISQIPGGKAVFGPLTVVENLRLYGYALGRDRARVDRGIETAMATFPRLAERRNALASTMSGGEQQMLAMSKAFILSPELLLIDELSLGLAPKIVGELLEMVRAINATGTAVVLVEQSVNVALTLAHRAYFMEKGAVRFDGPTAELLDRPDVLRSVFLQGAAKGLTS